MSSPVVSLSSQRKRRAKLASSQSQDVETRLRELEEGQLRLLDAILELGEKTDQLDRFLVKVLKALQSSTSNE